MRYALAITGPTASGKTAVSLEVASRLGCEVISCDSMQIYRGMDIGTAKATSEEQALVQHHLIDIISPRECYSAEAYREDAMRSVDDIIGRGRIPLFVGGTGLYIDTLMRGAPKSPPSDEALRERLTAIGETEEGRAKLYGQLSLIDPESAEKTHMNNLRRVVRALEIYELTGIPKSSFDRESREVEAELSVGMITLDFHNRENLYGRVDERVDIMIRDGLLEEARGLFDSGVLTEDTTAASAIGYKELVPYFRGEISLYDACEEIKLSTRRYAKRQLTWFRHEKDAYRLFVDTENGVMKDKQELCNEAVSITEELLSGIKKE